MPKAGTYTALQRLQPIQTDFGEIAKEAAATEEARRAKKQAEIDAEKERKSKLAKQFGVDYAGLNNIVTKTKSIDEAYARGINSARDRMGYLYKQIEQNPTMANDVKTQIQLQNLKNFSKNLKTVSDRYTEYATMIGTGMQDGSLSNWNEDQLSDLDSIFRQANLDVTVDEETGMPVAVIAELDENGEPTGELKELNLIEVLDGRGLNQAVNTFEFQDSVTDIGSKLGKREVKTPGSGLTHIEYQKFDDIEPQVRTMIQGFIGSEKNPTDIAKSIWADQMAEGPKDLTAEDMKRIEDFYVNSIKGFYDEKNKTTKDFGTGFRYSQEAKKGEEEKGLGIQVRTDEAGKPMMKQLVGVKGVPQGNYYQFTIPAPIKLGIKGETREITNLMINEAGEVAYEENIYKGKISGKPLDIDDVDAGKITGEVRVDTGYGGGLGADELNDIARGLGYRNTKELKDALQESVRGQAPKGEIDTSKYN